jgi:hypothetical protein
LGSREQSRTGRYQPNGDDTRENCRWPPSMDGRLIVSTFDKTHVLGDRYSSTIDELRNKLLCLGALASWGIREDSWVAVG